MVWTMNSAVITLRILWEDIVLLDAGVGISHCLFSSESERKENGSFILARYRFRDLYIVFSLEGWITLDRHWQQHFSRLVNSLPVTLIVSEHYTGWFKFILCICRLFLIFWAERNNWNSMTKSQTRFLRKVIFAINSQVSVCPCKN